MKIRTLFSLLAVLSCSASMAATVVDINSPVYTKDSITYTGTNGDTLSTSSTTLPMNSTLGEWSVAFTVSGLATTTGSDVGLLFSENSISSVVNANAVGYQLSSAGQLTLCIGGFNYNGNLGNSPWKTQIVSGFDPNQPLTLFYNMTKGQVTLSIISGTNQTIIPLPNLSGGAAFSSNVSQFNFSQKSTSGGTAWNMPNGVAGQYTLNNWDVYEGTLSDEQKRQYAANAVASIPEPSTASIGLLGMGLLLLRRSRRK